MINFHPLDFVDRDSETQRQAVENLNKIKGRGLKEKLSRFFCPLQVNTKHLYSIYTMLVQRRRRWADVV